MNHNLQNVTIISNYDIIKQNISKIPRSLHMIWVGENKAPEYVNTYFLKWKELMPEWSIFLWKNEDINIDHFSLKTINLINYSNKGAQKADIMRYFIIEKYGGFYIDTDIIPCRSFDLLLNEWSNASVFLCHDLDLTWEYIINAFFGAVPNHPVFGKACELIYETNINTEDIHLETGPRLLGKAVANTNFKKDEVILLPINYFYKNLNYPYRFGHHFYSKLW